MSYDFKNIPFLKGGSESFFTQITNEAHAQTYTKGKILFIHEEKATHFYVIKSGWVKLFRETLDGTQSVVDILPAGHVFGETAIFEDNTYPYSAEIIEKAEIISAPISTLKQEIENNNTLALNMLTTMARYRRQQDRELEHRTIQNAPQRIGCFLLRLTNQNEKGPVTIHLPYDKTLVASRLGMQPETFSRALSKLKENIGMQINGATIEIDTLDSLINFSCAACSSEFPCKDLACTNNKN